MGNIRVSYSKNASGSAEVLEENNFYPFGMKHEGYNQTAENPSYNYGYNGKEYQTETGWSDYGARMYMSDIGRWGVIDPLAETSRRFTPYNYAYNNPVMFIDPDGRKAMAPKAPAENLTVPGGMLDYYGRGGTGKLTNLLAFLGQENYFHIADDTMLGGGGGGSGPTFQFPKGTEEYYQKNYPAFYNLVKNILPNILKDPNYLKALMEVTGMSEETLKKAFTYGQGPTLHDRESNTEEALYDYSRTFDKADLNSISINTEVLAWFEKADKDPNTVAGLTNLFYMVSLVGHETAHWGANIKNAGSLKILNVFCNPVDGATEHGKAFEARMYNIGIYPNGYPAWGLDSGNYGSNISKYLIDYVTKKQQMLHNIFK
ncbi:RHS repeat-associated protein [Chryseobacterium ginsenosidimutans]|uniref:RHS repeat-associated core domain-containing protein n=1 Tax=Chryseobacterium ginsenosidimutans TaxID=687846 RepID=UPI0027890C3C|nr:RHS repeat-associated core domain-containing protein [Chryseobacterium ginsenosidimutans]MDQ0593709.1 RHS repeat-associated protein [Chryseobacterium ginsenosidimutans]